jgi:hypothetical protein
MLGFDLVGHGCITGLYTGPESVQDYGVTLGSNRGWLDTVYGVHVEEKKPPCRQALRLRPKQVESL